MEKAQISYDDSVKDVINEIQQETLKEASVHFGHPYYSVTFTSKENYLSFKSYALEFSKSDYVFEGDVLDILRIVREYGGLVELQPLNDFDINYVLARLLGLRDDY